MSTPPALALRGLIKRYGDVTAVAGLDLTVARGECFGLLGPNGAGKTTTIEICEGLTEADEGEVRVLGMTHREHSDEIRASIGISLQETQLTEKLTVEETIQGDPELFFLDEPTTGLDPSTTIDASIRGIWTSTCRRSPR